MSCLLAVLKLAYGSAPSAFGSLTSKTMTSEEHLNPFMKYAWKDLRQASTQTMNDLSQAVWQMPLTDVLVAESQFSAIVSSENLESCYRVNHSIRDNRRLLWSLSVAQPADFNFEASPLMDWEKEINSLFCVFGHDELELATPTASPLVIGVQFTVRDVTRRNRLKLEHFGAFELQHFGMEKRYDDCFWRKREGKQYTALAIVKFRKTPDGLDSIRGYDRNQKLKVPAPEAAYANPDWEVSQFDNGDSFFVLYERHIYKSRSIDQGEEPHNEEEWDQFVALYDP